MMRAPILALREVSADTSRPFDRLMHGIEAAADAVGRWAWIKSYERAEATYWTAGKDKQQCK